MSYTGKPGCPCGGWGTHICPDVAPQLDHCTQCAHRRGTGCGCDCCPSVFALGRMRHLDLLALWCQLHPGQVNGCDKTGYRLARASKENLVAAILAST